MATVWGLVVVALSLLCWGGQAVSWFNPTAAAGAGLAEAEADVDPLYWADIRGEALWDTLTLWPMLVAGALLITGHDAWPYFGLVGSGMYFYFAGRGIVTRLIMQQQSHRIGSQQSVKVGLAALTVWGIMAAITMVAAIDALQGA